METEVCWQHSLWEAGRAAGPSAPDHDSQPGAGTSHHIPEVSQKAEEGAGTESGTARKSR